MLCDKYNNYNLKMSFILHETIFKALPTVVNSGVGLTSILFLLNGR